MKASTGLLQIKGYFVAIFVICALGVIASWRNVNRPAPTKYDILLLLGLAFCTFIFVSMTVRSPFIGDRTVFGPIALAFLSQLAVDLFRPPVQTVHSLRFVIVILWLVSLVAWVVVLLRRIRI